MEYRRNLEQFENCFNGIRNIFGVVSLWGIDDWFNRETSPQKWPKMRRGSTGRRGNRRVRRWTIVSFEVDLVDRGLLNE